MRGDSEVGVTKITISGNDRTSLSFFDAELKDINTRDCTIHELAQSFAMKTEKLLSMDMFEAVDTNIEIGQPKNGKFDATVRINVKEKGIPFLKVASYVKAGATAEVGCELQSALRNPIGYGEVFKLSSVTTQSGAKEFLTSLNIPNVGPQKFDLNITAKSAMENMSYYTSFKQKIDSVSLEMNSQDKKHQIVAEYALRDEMPVSSIPSTQNTNPTTSTTAESKNNWNLFNSSIFPASAITTNTAMASLKTSLKYLWTALDTRDCSTNPSTGSYLQGSVEVATPPGSAQFLRTELTAQHHHTLGPSYLGQPGLVASVCGSVGVLRPILSAAVAVEQTEEEGVDMLRHGIVHLCDRYHLGGPNSLRGFGMCGTGPRSYRPVSGSGNLSSLSMPLRLSPSDVPPSLTIQGAQLTDSLGGDLRTTLLATLSVPVPVPMLAKSQMRAFTFFNAGMISCLSDIQMNGIYATTGLGALRASVGGGFSVAAAGAVRLEATYSIPILAAPQDQTKGFQIGIGVTMN